jgi:hypothetical protein
LALKDVVGVCVFVMVFDGLGSLRLFSIKLHPLLSMMVNELKFLKIAKIRFSIL